MMSAHAKATLTRESGESPMLRERGGPPIARINVSPNSHMSLQQRCFFPRRIRTGGSQHDHCSTHASVPLYVTCGTRDECETGCRRPPAKKRSSVGLFPQDAWDTPQYSRWPTPRLRSDHAAGTPASSLSCGGCSPFPVSGTNRV